MTDVRVDHTTFGQVSIASVMRFDSRFFRGLRVSAPEFPVSRSAATEAITARTAELGRVRGDHDEEKARAWLSRDVLHPGDVALLTGELELDADERGSWVGFVDLDPLANFGHPCVLCFVDANAVVREAAVEFCPRDLRDAYTRIV